jgi:glyoxylase-like metal-dependent hydrolase (beta-lactamase superfamily II)
VIFDTLVVGELESNCYVLADEGSGALVIDPGGDARRIIEHLEAKGLAAASVVNTHGHADHIAANAELRKRWPDVKIAIGRADAKALTSPLHNMSLFVARLVKSPKADRLLDDGDVVELGRGRFRVLSTPGHTPGGICLYTEDLDGRSVLFSGDTLFADSVGRTDIPGGNRENLIRGIREKIFVLPDETDIYPGHGPATTVGHEKKFNPFAGEAADKS